MKYSKLKETGRLKGSKMEGKRKYGSMNLV